MSEENRAAGAPGRRRDPGPDPRERILRAAAQSFAKEGYERTRMTALARLAGVSRAALYKTFSTKAELLHALNAFVIAQWRVWLQESVAASPTAREAIERWLREGLADDWRVEAVRILTAEGAQGELLMDRGATRRALEETRHVLAEVIRHGLETGELRPGIAPDATAHALQALLLGLQRNHATERPIVALENDRDVDALIELVLGGLLRERETGSSSDA